MSMDPRIVTRKLETLRAFAVEEVKTLPAWSRRTALHLEPGRYAFDGKWERTAIPDRIAAGRTVFYRTTLRVPAALPRDDAFLFFDLDDLEGQLFVNDEAYAGVDANHLRVPLPAGKSLRLVLEFLSVPKLFCKPEIAAKTGCFLGARVGVVDRAFEALCDELQFAFEAISVCSDERRKALLEKLVESTCLAIDLTLPREALVVEVQRARTVFRKQLATIQPDPEAGRVFAIGHSHIDTGWLWPIRESIRKCGRTFSTACRMLEQHDEYYFSCSQPQHYAYTKAHYPEVYRQIKRWVKAGRWGTDGAMWVEADCNITSGESLVRQILYGLDFFKREFGTTTRICWLPDVFGYNASLPQILKGCGIDHFYTYKLHWQARNVFPYSLFHWRGLDGSEILAHIPNAVNAYNGTPNPHQLSQHWDWHRQKAEYPEALFPYGYGDGGGGANDRMLGMLKTAQGSFPGLPALRTGPLGRFFDDIDKAAPDLPVWDGELYLETHRGTLSTQGRMKRANRTSELRLRDAEVLASMAALSNRKVSTKPLRQAWETTCLHQFHDILPGSSIGMVYDEALRDHETVQTTAGAVIDEALQAVMPSDRGASAGLCLFNSLSWPRHDVVCVEAPSKTIRSVIDADGEAHPVQIVKQYSGRSALVLDGAAVPAMGYSVLGFSSKACADSPVMTVTTTRLETPLYRIRLNRDGAITSLYDKTHKRQILERGKPANDLQLFQDGPELEDAWNVHATFEKRRYPFSGTTTVEVLETGPLRGIVRVTRQHRATTIEQDLIVYAHTPRIDFVTRVDWQERQTMLKAAFPVAIRSTRATYEVQFGAVERPTHHNTSWDAEKFEVAAQRWVDLSESGYGVSLLNDCKYGHDIRNNVLRITLLRGTTWPDPKADEGEHEFTYSLFPHAGNWTEAETVRRAWELNAPLTAVTPVQAAPYHRSLLTIDGPAIVQAMKPAEDGQGIILRLYEPHGARGPVTVRAPGISRVTETNLIEAPITDLKATNGRFRFSIRPFQIRTFKLKAQ
ncbi:MAG TPA: hypothetical protein DIT01_21110 [Lentisphaeria bacterium]|nr:hypothetical protein [Lentisphaeria bacterium]|tara:strand:+ start:85 stop:3147 length:3063 start_codon:yes stop_codon:yes gene_type:complete